MGGPAHPPPPPPPATLPSGVVDCHPQNQNEIEPYFMDQSNNGQACDSTCCELMEPDPSQVQPCTCETIEVPTTSSERSSSFNSCTLPLKPLKGILKKSRELNPCDMTSMTLPRDARFTIGKKFDHLRLILTKFELFSFHRCDSF